MKLREKGRLRMFENRMLRRIFRPKWDEITREWRKLENEEFTICTHHQTLFRDKIKKKCDGRGMLHELREKRGVYRFWWGNLRESVHLEDPAVDGRIILRWVFGKWDYGAWTLLIWLRIGIRVT
jgi:hypothetical protein